MTNSAERIPDNWPGQRAHGFLRALYNIAIHRLGPAKLPETDCDFVSTGIYGVERRLLIRAACAKASWEVALPMNLCEGLREERRNCSPCNVGLLAVLRHINTPVADTTVRTWLITDSVLEKTLDCPPARRDGRWLVQITDPHRENRWMWRSGGTKIDVASFYGVFSRIRG
jgi:hypothetical protein